ncbi:cob(I)yrinic acid a,c-diamide adenosyltransferase [Amphritea japonica]|uniref:Corrinoid adenosyltransferase n=1 Tax=Amphritea japonica ATCC BAA-1530 TaxID=1278309 RepID=A0A7R6SU07_9GAMM|nr:cob(I)yrinic acid a,c-diamide adenosyltransferase [Amphritea japonica]BBB27255.1 cob(I)alamin adenosyltransferase [Amphritea japonica ATCC BAA-1530]
MANRLTKIYTRTGDKGTTSLANGSKVNKDHPRIETLGDADELNCLLGVLIAELTAQEPLRKLLIQCQNDLFDLGGELAVADPDYQVITAAVITEMEQQIDRLNSHLPPLKEFILPGGNRVAALCHQARSVCRRAERRIVELARQETVNQEAATYLNRLSDLLFVAARILARQDDGEEVLWSPRKPT